MPEWAVGGDRAARVVHVFPDRPSLGRGPGCPGGYGVIAMETGKSPTLIALPALLVAVLIGVTVPETALATLAVIPSGVIALATGSLPILMALPTVLVAARISVTVPEAPLVT